MLKGKTKIFICILCIFLGLLFLVFVGFFNTVKKHSNLRIIFEEYEVEVAPLEGNGTKNDPYLISSVEDLVLFRDNVNDGYLYEEEYVRQTVDLDLSSIENWIPIGEYGEENRFYGYYEGAGHTISNLNIYDPGVNVGFFGVLAGTVSNLGIESGNIHGACAGSIASHSSGRANIINCYNRATVTGSSRASGIADNFSGNLIYNCVNYGELNGPRVAGIACYDGKVIDCYSSTEPVVNEEFEGVYKATDKAFSLEEENVSGEDVTKALNKNLKSISINYLYSIPVAKWSVDNGVGFDGIALNLYPLWFAIGAVILFATAFVIQFFYLSSEKNAVFSIKHIPSYLGTKWTGFKEQILSIGRFKFYLIQAFIATYGLAVLAVLLGNFSSIFSLTYDNCTGLFCDYYVPVKSVADKGLTIENFYDVGENYPPVARWITLLFSVFIPIDHVYFEDYQTSIASFILIAYTVFAMILLYRAFEKRLNLGKYRMLVVLALVFSSPMMFVLERANILLITIIFSAFFLIYYDSDSRAVRELALISLAIAASIKLYPAILGLLLIHDKRYKQAVRCAVYGITVFFGPFLFIGGSSALRKFIENLTDFSSVDSVGVRDQLMNFTNVSTNIFNFMGIPEIDGRELASKLLIAVVILLLVAAVILKERWKSLTALTLLLVLIPNSSGYYMMAFYIFPLFLMLQKKEHSVWDAFYAVFLSICVLPSQFMVGLLRIPPTRILQIIASAQLVLAAGLIIELFAELLKFAIPLISKKSSKAVSK